jgi:hypothetical protein
MPEKVYRTILIAEKISNNELGFFYGHSIEWLMSPIDYSINCWKSHDLSSLKVFYVDLLTIDDLERFIANNKFSFEVSGKPISLQTQFNEQHKEFLTTEYGSQTDSYKPLMGFCTHVTYHYHAQDEDDQQAEIINKKLHQYATDLEKIADEYQIDIKAYPHLINTFSFYTPNRIEESSRAIREPFLGYQLHIYDPFMLYQDADVTVTAQAENETLEDVRSFKVHEAITERDCGFIPDSITTDIKIGDEQIYFNKGFFIKAIHFNMNAIVTDKIIDIGGKVIEQQSESKSHFVVKVDK